MGVNMFGDARGFPTQQKDIVSLEVERRVGRCSFGCEQQDPAVCSFGAKVLPRWHAVDCCNVKIIHSGTSQFGIIPSKASRLNDYQLQSQAGTEPGESTGVGCNVRLVKCQFNHDCSGLAGFSEQLQCLRMCDILWLDKCWAGCQIRQDFGGVSKHRLRSSTCL